MQPSDSHLIQQYFAYKTDVGLENNVQQIDSFQRRCSLTRFRFGQHWLQCHRGRFHGLPYEARVCIARVQHVASEHDALFDWDFADLFRESDSVYLITRNPPVRVAHFLQECQEWDALHSAEGR